MVITALPSRAADGKEETPHRVFFAEYIRELGANDDVRAAGEKELGEAKDDHEKLSNAIHSSTLIQLELRSQIEALKTMTLNAPYEQVIPNIIDLYGKKVEAHQSLIDITEAFLAGPKPGVDFAALAAQMPKLRARLDYIDKTLFDACPLVFATLVDSKPDSKNHLSHLVITKDERAKLISKLDVEFGKKLTQKNQNYIVSQAIVLKTYLQKGFKSSDEPWY